MKNQDIGIFQAIRMMFGSTASIVVNAASTIDKFTIAGAHIGEVAVITSKGYEKEAIRNNEYEGAIADLKYSAKLTKLHAKYAKAGKTFVSKADKKLAKRAKREQEVQAQVNAAVQAAVDEAKASKAK